MSDLVVFTYNDSKRAAEVLTAVAKLKQENVHKALIGIEDAAVVIKDQEGAVHIKQTLETMVKGSGIASGGLWGVLVGFLFGGPLTGALLGMAVSALLGHDLDIGIDNKFIADISNQIRNDSSALFLLVKDTPPETVAAAMQQYGGTLLHTSLSDAARQAFVHVSSQDAVKNVLEKTSTG